MQTKPPPAGAKPSAPDALETLLGRIQSSGLGPGISDDPIRQRFRDIAGIEIPDLIRFVAKQVQVQQGGGSQIGFRGLHEITHNEAKALEELILSLGRARCRAGSGNALFLGGIGHDFLQQCQWVTTVDRLSNGVVSRFVAVEGMQS